MELLPRKNILHRIGGELIALIVLVPLIIILGVLLVKFNRFTTETPTLTTSITVTPVASTTSFAVSPFEQPAAQIIALEIKNSASLKTYSLAVTSEITVAELLEQAKAQGLQFITKDYGGSLGLFIESINGQASDPATQHYWHLYVNNQRSPLGASSTRVKVGDTVRWSFEKQHNE